MARAQACRVRPAPASGVSVNSFVGDLGHLLRGRRFRELFLVRVTSQCGDGVFQVALASYVLFSPERQPDAASIALALTAVLVPFSALGPFAGVFLDRWDRRRILIVFNALRAVPVLAVAAVISANGDDTVLFVLAIAAFSINRFLLAGLSASLPRVVHRDDLVLANALTPTSGTIAFMLGLAAGAGLHRIDWGIDADTAIAAVAAYIYLTAGYLASRIPAGHLGPDLHGRRPHLWAEIARVARGLVEGLQHLRRRPVAATALGAIGAHRFWYGLTAVSTILLYRNYFNDPADSDAGLAGLAAAVLALGLGVFAAALVTPLALRRLSPRTWIVVLLVAAAAFQAFPASLYTQPAVIAAAFVLGLAGQGVKICVDTLVQLHVDDDFRGRVFSLYDVMFNAAFVAAAAVGAAVIPENGKSYGLIAAVSLGYAATALAYARLSPRRDEQSPATAADAP